MAGQHIEREARYAATKLTPLQRKEYIRRLYNAGYSESQIAKAVGLSKSGTHWIIQDLKGKPRVTTRVMCEGCWQDFPKTQLNDNGLCPDCRPRTPELPAIGY
jgi:AraC-like DNA-binding protein